MCADLIHFVESVEVEKKKCAGLPLTDTGESFVPYRLCSGTESTRCPLAWQGYLFPEFSAAFNVLFLELNRTGIFKEVKINSLITPHKKRF